MKSMSKCNEMHQRALQVMPGPHSNLHGYETKPIYVVKGEGSHVWDADGNEYIDYMCGIGAGLLGYTMKEFVDAVKDQVDTLPYLGAGRRNFIEVELAEKLVKYIPSAEKVRFMLSGSEAVQLAIRLARAYTGRNLFIRFNGHYHGWLDNVLGDVANNAVEEPPYGIEKEGGHLFTHGRDPHAVKQSFKLLWNDIDSLEHCLQKYGEQVGMIIMEPVNCNAGVCHPKPGYLKRVRELCDEYGIVLCFDEIITGFRMGLGGAQSVFGVTPDISTFGKAISNGVPFSAVVGKAEIMDQLLEEKVIGAGTYNGYTLGIAAALANVKILEKDDGAIYKRLRAVQEKLTKGLKEVAHSRGIPVLLQQVDGCFFYQFIDVPVANSVEDWILAADHQKQNKFRSELFDSNILVLPSGRWYVSMSVTEEDVDKTVEAAKEILGRI